MKILILGAGGVGGYFGARLIDAGADITYLVRKERQQQLSERGLTVYSPHGNLSLQIKTVTADDATPDFDVIVLAPKAYDLDASLASLAQATQGNAVLLPLLNGVTHMQQLDALFGKPRVMGGVAHIAAVAEGVGIVRQLNELHSLTIGPRDPAHQAIARNFFVLCQKARFNSIYSDNIEQSLWAKWTFLATLAGATTLYRGSVGQIVAAASGEKLVRCMYQECLAVANGHGFAIAAPDQEKALAMLTQPKSSLTSSMLRDLLSGQRTEHHHILGQMIAMGQEKNIEAPLLEAAYCHMLVETAKST